MRLLRAWTRHHAAWLRYRLCRLVALPRPVWDDTRYPRTIAGGWLHIREWTAAREVEDYERHHPR